jgi:hypothetical protein
VSDIFRDPTEGTLARRQDLLRRRRDELVTMPHAIRRVYVARHARIAASLAMLAGGGLLAAAAASPTLAGGLARAMPGPYPAVLSTLLIGAWVLAALGYLLGRAHAEHKFAVAMSRYVLPGDDLELDVERLAHEHPDEVARQMGHRLEVASAALPVLAAGVLLPATAVFVANAIVARGWPAIYDLELELLWCSSPLLISAAVGAVASVVMTRRFARTHTGAVVAGVAAVITGAIAARAFAAGEIRATWLFTVPALLAGTAAFLGWRLRVERDRLETEDPAAGSEVLTLRGLVRGACAVVGTVGHALSLDSLRRAGRFVVRHPGQHAVAIAAIVGVVVFAQRGEAPVQLQERAVTAPAAAHMVVATGQFQTGWPFETERLGDGRLRVTVELPAETSVELENIAGLTTIPRGWNARVHVALETASPAGGDAFVTLLGADEPQLGAASLGHTFSQAACRGVAEPLGLRLYTERAGTYTLIVAPVLEPAGC